jgi:hypothetical protein
LTLVYLVNTNYQIYNPSIVNNSITLNITNKITANNLVSMQFTNIINPSSEKVSGSLLLIH